MKIFKLVFTFCFLFAFTISSNAQTKKTTKDPKAGCAAHSVYENKAKKSKPTPPLRSPKSKLNPKVVKALKQTKAAKKKD